MLRNGRSVSEIINLISVTDREYGELCAWAAEKPPIASHIDEMMAYRDRVLKAFLLLLEGHEASAKSL